MSIKTLFSFAIRLAFTFFSSKAIPSSVGLSKSRTLRMEALQARELFAVFSCDVSPYGVVGTSTADVLNASSISENVVFGLGGNDQINVTGGAGRVCGGGGDDLINSGLWTADIAYGGVGNDVLNGSWGNDLLYGDEGSDRIDGGADDDELHGGADNDFLFSGLGNNKLFGEDGDDTLFPQGGSNLIDGGTGIDVISVAGRYADFDLRSSAAGWQLVRNAKPTEVNALLNSEYVQFQDKWVWISAQDESQQGELLGTAGDDQLLGAKPARNLIRGLAGNDSITVTSGFGFIYAGDGDDIVNSGVWSDDLAYGGNGNDKIYGQWGNDTLFGEAGNDLLYGGAGDDIMDGGDGNDVIYADFGNDTLLGGNGNDSLYPQAGSNVVDGGPDRDSMFLPGRFADFVLLYNSDGSVSVGQIGGTFSAKSINVEFFVFQDGVYDVQTKQFPVTQPPTDGAPSSVPLETVVPQSIVDTMVDVSTIPDGIVALKVQNIDAINSAAGYVTIGHAFQRGDVPRNFTLGAKSSGRNLEIQTDVKARYDDGSIKHAILTLNVPRLDAKSTANTGLLDVVLTRLPEVVMQPLAANDILNAGVNLSVDVSLSKGDGEWLIFASEKDRTRPLWREELINTRDNLVVPVELRLPANTTAFPLTIKGTVYTNGKSEQVLSRVINITPQGNTAKLDLSAILAGTVVDRVWISGTPAGTSVPAGIDLANGTKTSLPTVNVSNLLAQAIANRSYSTWMSGPSVVEIRIEQILDPSLKARFDIRYYRDGTIRTNVIMLNETPTYSIGNRNIAYDIVAKQGSVVRLQYAGINHTRNSNWSELIWNRNAPALHVIENAAYLLKTGAVPQYDLSLPVAIDSTTYAGMNSRSLPFGPMARGITDNAMPDAGERSDIGPLPDWAARYILTQDNRDLQVLLGNGKVSGSVPWHFIDGTTGNYLSIKDHPKVWLEQRGTSPYMGEDALPAGSFDYRTGWIPDLAHQPSLNFVPYLVTGDRYFADELSAQANWTLANEWTTARQQSSTQDLVFYGEVRAFGWTMRTLGEAAYILPDASPFKAHLNAVVNNNLQWVISTYVDGTGPYQGAPRGMLEGLFDDPWNDQRSSDVYGTASLWMDDYVAASMGTLVGRGFDDASKVLNWQANVLAGRYAAEDLGMSPFNGAIYQMPTTKSNDPFAKNGPTKPSEGYTLKSWQEVQSAIDVKGQNATKFAEVSPDDIATRSMNGISAMMSYADNVDAYEAYGFLAAGTFAKRHTAIFSLQPRNSIQPVLSDGTLLVLKLQKMGGTGADQLDGSSSSELLQGNEGNDVLNGKAGVDLLYGGTGNDQLFGDEGDDYLFGNEGDDQLFGGPGNDTLRGNVGADLLNGGAGDDVIYYQGDDTVLGGIGTDTLALQNWRQAAIDLHSGKFSSIESIDLRNSPNFDVAIVDTLTVDMTKIPQVSDSNSLIIRADSSDRITLLGSATRAADITFGAQRFAQFTNGQSRLYVLLGTSVNGTALTGLPIGEGEAQLIAHDPLDVSGDQIVTPLDALQIINFLNQTSTRSASSSSVIDVRNESWIQFDVDGNGKVSPLDVLLIINRINSNAKLETPSVQASDTSDIGELSKSKLQLRNQLVANVQQKI